MTALPIAAFAPGSPLRYAAAGVVNTAAGYAVILMLGACGAVPLVANAAGFAAGFLVSLALAQRFTFAPTRRGGARGRYAVAFAACWSLNAAAMTSLRMAGLPDAAAQGVGVTAYAVAFYLVCRWWVFGDAALFKRDVDALSRGASAVRLTPVRLVITLIAGAQLVALCGFWVQSRDLTVIAHAGGAAGGRSMTNSLAAMEQSLASGITLIEVDLHRLADGTVVCAHDWDAFGGKAPSRTAWQARFDGTDRPLPCTARSAGAWLRANPDAVIVTDVKADQAGVLAELASLGWPPAQTLVQIYAPEEADLVRALGFERMLITLYRYDGPMNHIAALAAEGTVEAIAMPDRLVARGEAKRLSRTGVPIYTHTVNGWVTAGIYAMRGVDGIYTDRTDTRWPHPFSRAR